MKGIFGVGAVAIVAGLGWWYVGSSASTPTVGTPMITETENVDMMDDTMAHDGAAVKGDVVVDVSTAPANVNTAQAKVFSITGKNFEFSQKEIKVKQGDTVTVNFESTSGFHDWKLDEFNAHTQQVRPGTKTSTTFVADKVGTFEYYCSVGDHRAQGMSGRLVVE